MNDLLISTMTYRFSVWLVVILSLFACHPSKKEKLPILGERQLDVVEVSGKKRVDKVYHTIAPFSLIDKAGQPKGFTPHPGRKDIRGRLFLYLLPYHMPHHENADAAGVRLYSEIR